MKNLKLLMLAAALSFSAVSVTSCSSDDSSPVTEEQQQEAIFEGKWYVSKEGVSVNGFENLQNYQHTAGCTKDHSEFVAGGTFKDREYWGTECEVDELTGTWSKTGNNVTVTIDGVARNFEIVSMTATEMKARELVTMNGQSYYDITVFTRS